MMRRTRAEKAARAAARPELRQVRGGVAVAGFDIATRELPLTGVVIHCKRCRAMWSYPSETLSPGAELALLDHAAGHTR